MPVASQNWRLYAGAALIVWAAGLQVFLTSNMIGHCFLYVIRHAVILCAFFAVLDVADAKASRIQGENRKASIGTQPARRL